MEQEVPPVGVVVTPYWNEEAELSKRRSPGADALIRSFDYFDSVNSSLLSHLSGSFPNAGTDSFDHPVGAIMMVKLRRQFFGLRRDHLGHIGQQP